MKLKTIADTASGKVRRFDGGLKRLLAVFFWINACIFVPQILALLATKNSQGHSVIMWSFFFVGNATMTLSFFADKKYALASGTAMSSIFSFVMTCLVVAYR